MLVSGGYPEDYKKGLIPYYPINDSTNQSKHLNYMEKSKTLTNFIFGGRLSEYKYMDMHVVIESAMNKFKTLNQS
jgi:UDP-galactopyranose mutase